MPYTPRRATKGRREPKAGNGVAGRRAAGVLVSPRIAHAKATRLITVNAPNILSSKKRRNVVNVGKIHGFKTVNAPGSGRKSLPSSSTIHRVNAPKGRY